MLTTRLAWHGVVPCSAMGPSERSFLTGGKETQGSRWGPALTGSAVASDGTGPKTSGITRGACLTRMYPAITTRNTAKIRLSAFWLMRPAKAFPMRLPAMPNTMNTPMMFQSIRMAALPEPA